MDKNALSQAVERGLTQKQIALDCNCSQTTVKYWLSKFGLQTVASLPKALKCRVCGETEESEFYKYPDGRKRYRCKRCDLAAITERYRVNKKEAVDYKGGKCQICGYSKCLGALDFHHKDPKQKDPNWKRMRYWSLEKLKAELDKCLLVCRNCHAEIHYKPAIGEAVSR